MSIKLIACDMDGTLLNSAGKISEESIKSVLAATKAGIKVTIATGRMFSSVQKYAKELDAVREAAVNKEITRIATAYKEGQAERYYNVLTEKTQGEVKKLQRKLGKSSRKNKICKTNR